MRGYWDNPDATAATLAGGWLHTGDIGHLDAGYLHLTDRAKDVIITGGSNVYPARSRKSCSPTRPSARPPSSASPIPSGASRCGRSSSRSETRLQAS
jgi:hypothetical protein